MPIRPTVFVVGAGASSEVGLPIGAELRKTIAEKLDTKFELGYEQTSGDRSVVEALRQLAHSRSVRDFNPHLRAGRMISEAMYSGLAGSIDAFLDHHSNNKVLVEVGKIAIAIAILEAEASCSLQHREHGQPPYLPAIAATWYPLFLNLIGSSVKAEELDRVFESTTIICFNYDRCIEHFLYHALQVKFLCRPDRAQELIAKLKIFHPYGTVGTLPWQRLSGPSIVFGGETYGRQVLDAALALRTFTEQWEDTVALGKIRNAVVSADALIFLGFGFVPQNLELLAVETRCKASDVFFTAAGISESDRRHVQNGILRSFFDRGITNPPRFYESGKCSEMFSEHYHGLLHFVTS